MRHQPAHAARGGRLPSLLRAPTPMRATLSVVAASVIGIVPAVVIASPASAVPGDLTMTAQSAAEGSALTFTLAREGDGVTNLPEAIYSVTTVATGPNAATAGTDYTLVTTTVTFPADPAGAPQSMPISVTTVGDTLDEHDETFSVEVRDVGTVLRASATGTITDDDSLPTFALTAVSPVMESAGPAVIRATLTTLSGRDVTIPVETLDGNDSDATLNAVAPGDYTALPPNSTITVPAGQQTGSVNVPIINDTVYEAQFQSFTASVEVAGADYATPTAGGDSVAVTIEDNDTKPTVAIGGAGTVVEGGALGFPLTLNGQSELPVSVLANSGAVGDTATSPSDYNAISGQTITFAPNSTNQTLLVTTLGDALNEETPESLTATISLAANATLGTATATGVITDDDVPPTILTLLPSNAAEADTGSTVKTFTVTLSGPSGRDATIAYVTGNGSATAGQDYTAVTTGSLIIPAGSTTGTIDLTVLNDTTYEGDETLTLTLSSPDGTIGAGGAIGANTITITDNDAKPTYSIADLSVAEGNAVNTAQMVVSLSNPSAFAIYLTIGKADVTAVSTGTAPGDDDYTVGNTALIISAGAATANAAVTINGDAVYEAAETATISLSPTGGELGVDNATPLGVQHSATLTINNDDSKPVLSLNTQSGTEGTNLLVIGTLTGQAQDSMPVTLTYSGDASGSNYPAAANDYLASTTTATIAAGQAPSTDFVLATISLLNDDIDEAAETVKVVVHGTTPTLSADAMSTYKVNDDPGDLPPSITISDESIVENLASVNLTASLVFDTGTTDTQQIISVPYMTVNGSAYAPADYTAKTGTVTFLPGDTTKSINVLIINDTVHEMNQDFYVRLGTATPVGAEVTKTDGEVTIVDNDGPGAPTLSAPASRIGAGSVTVTGVAGEGSSVHLWTAPGTSGDTFNDVRSTTADQNGGDYSFVVSVPKGTRLYTRADGVNSPIKLIRVVSLPVITGGSIAKGVISLRVTGNPKLPGQKVVFQRLNANRTWSSVGYGVLNSTGTYVATWRGLKSGSAVTYRAVGYSVPASGVLAGYSAAKRYGVR